MRRHLLDPVGSVGVDDVVRRLGAVQTQVASSAEAAVRVRREASEPGEVGRALAEGRLVKTWAMRGSLHLLTPEEGSAFLSLLAAGRSWERPSWQRAFGATPAVVDRLREVVREALDGQVLTREEVIEAVSARGLDHLAEGLRSGWGTLLKPLAWQGDLCFGPSRGARVTFQRPEAASVRWVAPPEADVAAPVAIRTYLRAYGPATVDTFGTWLAGGWFGKRQLRAWFASLGDELAEVEVDGEPAYLLAEDLDDVAASKASSVVRLLPAFDQWVLGPTTADGHVTPAARRSAVSRQAGWIAPVAVVGGAVRGTWELDGGRVRVAWFAEAGPVPRDALAEEVARLAPVLGVEPDVEVSVA